MDAKRSKISACSAPGSREKLPRGREQKLLLRVPLGVSEIERELFLGVTTVKTHVQHLYEKLGVSDRAAAVAEAMRRGLIE
jgi:two-component system nitrate/nitrite response regulator NarL